ncbi:hypothetical protein [Streptomyces sp. NPDC095613]|uniref:hypothetical protein n=1 Tax=Streptomyces sp. NPDC095613 TaxID=3155540 RepID=UPI00333276A8
MSTVTARECAARWSVSPAHARRILAPLAPVGRDLATGAMQYDLAEADAAREAMPGQGRRTDLPAKQAE